MRQKPPSPAMVQAAVAVSNYIRSLSGDELFVQAGSADFIRTLALIIQKKLSS